ncbi:MAG: O-antigen ligase family protein [Lactobacillus sp.]|nr:O-antigen ligase family protein [Lactobacillus sp.]MDN6052740.1 O-antigen ligase family protein [Lactobacillus sp.]
MHRYQVKHYLQVFILIQPFLDLYWFYHGSLANTLPFTLPTIIRLLAMAVIFGLFWQKPSRLKQFGRRPWLITYVILLVLYSVVHLYYVRHFTSLSPTSYGYSTFSELFYLIRMLLPLLVLYFSYELDCSAQQLRRIVMGLSGLFSYTIVTSNLLVISLRSYESGPISANIFAWFTNPNLGYSHMASKGFFNFANMISAVLFMLLPLLIANLLERTNWQNSLALSIQALAMIEVGTKVALIGLIAGLAVSSIILVAHRLKERGWFKSLRPALLVLLLIELVALAITPFGPVGQRYRYEHYLAQQSDTQTQQLDQQLAAGLKKYQAQPARLKQFKQNFVKQHYQAYALNPKFVLKAYPYQRDPDFWLGIIRQPGELRMQNRYVETAMLNRVRRHHQQPLAYWLGISYTRVSNIFNLERDYVSQVYSLGLIGMLLFVGPSLLLPAYALLQWWRRKSAHLMALILASGFMVMAAFYSGNVLDFLTASLILAFIEGIMLKLANAKTAD